MSYQQVLQFLESLVNYEKVPRFAYKNSFKLERMQEFVKILGLPQENFKSIHIAGSKGKGSTAVFCAYILREAGFKTGLYTSPHLMDFRERIRILDKSQIPNPKSQNDFEGMISEEDVCNLVEYLKPRVIAFNKISRWGDLSFFEVYTALAFLYFKEQKVDFAVIETGLGGRLDATNAVNPLVCAITSLSLEHTQKLGNTLKEIAKEKCGIIKDGCVVISALQEKEAQEVIRNVCQDKSVRLYEINRDIFFERLNFNDSTQTLNVRSIFDEYPHLKIRLLGQHQLINAALGVGIIEALRFNNIFIKSQAIRYGLAKTTWPGRFEIASKNPLIVLDGAQNPASAAALKKSIKEFLAYKKLILVLGVSGDKDIVGICKQLKDISDVIILTQADNPRAAKAQYIKDKAKLIDADLTVNVKQALELANSLAGKEDLILITGSLFLVGEAKQLLLATHQLQNA